MLTLSNADQAREFVFNARHNGRSVGIVPTMGALHEGHLSLVRMSRERCDETVATIFVNPTQFAPSEDLEKYPRTLQQDCDALAAEGVAAVFVPTKELMYPDGFSTFVDPPSVARDLEGRCREGHFRGVTTIVMKLFQILPCTHAFFGRKDYQQLRVIEAMVRDLNFGIEIVAGETVRESDGLALSSRNRYLSDDQRKRALLLSQALNTACELAMAGESDVKTLQAAMRRRLVGDEGVRGVSKIDYAVIVNEVSLSPIDTITDRAVALIAAFVGQTRLIDNATIKLGEVLP